jgi:BirA family biotin operon repressor/biotin-[acetyl-CoA-carboxylase] ligase
VNLTAPQLQIAFRDAPWVRHFFFYPTIGSTNVKAKELAARGAEEGTLVIADCQTEGRGRAGRHWFSPPSLGLYLSFVFRPKVPVERAFGVHMAVALAAAQTAESTRPPGMIGIKWPNDLMAEGRKLAGLLTEIGTRGNELDWMVVGVGLNVNHGLKDFPDELRGTATSLRELCHRKLDRRDLLLDLVARVDRWTDRLADEGLPALASEWRRRSTILGREVRVETAGQHYVGTALRLAEDGALVIRLESGLEETVHAGDVHLLQYR